MYKLSMSNFLRISHTKNHKNRLIFDRVIGKIKGGRFFGTVRCLGTRSGRQNFSDELFPYVRVFFHFYIAKQVITSRCMLFLI